MWSDSLHSPCAEWIMCGLCSWKTTNLHFLHIHLTSHTEGGNYMYHHAAKTAFPVSHLVSSSTQTEASLLIDSSTQTESTHPVDNASQTDESYIKAFNLQSIFDASTHFEASKLRYHDDNTVKLEFGSSGYDTTLNRMFSNNEDEQALGNYDFEPRKVKIEKSTSGDVAENEMSNGVPASSDRHPVRWNAIKEPGHYLEGELKVKIEPKRKRKVRSTKSNLKVSLKRQKKVKRRAIYSDTDDYFEENNDNQSETAAGADLFDTDMIDDKGNIDLLDNTGTAKVSKRKKRKRVVNDKHVKYDPPKQLLQCHICHTQCKVRAYMCMHIESKHAGQYRWKCGFCRIPFVAEGDYLHHIKQCKDSWVKCHTCSECNHQNTFLSKKQLLAHLAVSHNNVFPLSCSVCKARIASEFDEREHMSEHNKEILKCRFCETVSKSIVESEIHMTSHVRENPYTCYMCDRAFATITAVREHVYTHLDDDGGCGMYTGYICELCGARFTHSRRRYTHYLTCKKQFQCKICGTVFPTLYSLKEHESIHDEARTYVCDQCGEAFAYKRALTYHVKSRHTVREGYTCFLCSRFFICKTSLDSHLLAHENLLPYSCEYCQRKFRDKKVLKRHERQHTGEKPYVCMKCGLAFTHNVSRKNHESKCNPIPMHLQQQR